MTRRSIAVQMYTLRDVTQTPAEMAAAFTRLKEIGYDAVQLSAGENGDTRALRDMLDNAGLIPCGVHTSYPRLRDALDDVLEELRVLDCHYVALGSLPPEYRNRDGYARFACEASAIAQRLAREGIVFSYHNHAFELERFDGRTGLTILYEESDPHVFTAEIDTYWIQYGGGNPASWLQQVRGRVPLVHLKDMAVIDNTQVMAEVGEGNLDWPAILVACQDAGVVWYIVEQDFCRRDPFVSVAISLRNLRAMPLFQ